MAASASIVNRPDVLSPVIGGLYYRLDSASASIADFKYVVDLYKYSEAGVSTFIGKFKFPPRPDNYGIFDVSKPLRSQLQYGCVPFQTGIEKVYGVYDSTLQPNVVYYITPGVEYAYGMPFANSYYTVTGAYTLGYTFSTPHGLLLGDIITIDKDNKQINPAYDGTCSVVQVVNAYHIGVDQAFGTSTTNETGNISYLLRMSTPDSTKLNTFNGVRQYDAAGENFGYLYYIGTASSPTFYQSSRALTKFGNTTDEYRRVLTYNNSQFALGDPEVLSVLTPGGNDRFTFERVRQYNSAGTLLSTNYIANPITTTYSSRLDVPTGPYNLINNGIDVANCTYYYIDFIKGATLSGEVLYNGGFTSSLGGWGNTSSWIPGPTDSFTITSNQAVYDGQFDSGGLTLINNVTSLTPGVEYYVTITTVTASAPYSNNLEASIYLGSTRQALTTSQIYTPGTYTFNITAGGTQAKIAVGTDGQGGSLTFDNMSIISAGTTAISKTYKYVIDTNNCNYTPYRLLFMNELGGTDFYNFKLDSKQTFNTQKTEFKKTLDWDYAFDTVRSGSSGYNMGPRGRTILSQKVTQQITITSDWITEKESIWLRELITSPEVYVIQSRKPYEFYDNSTEFISVPIIITDTSWQVKTYTRDKLFNVQITFEFANNIRVQNQ